MPFETGTSPPWNRPRHRSLYGTRVPSAPPLNWAVAGVSLATAFFFLLALLRRIVARLQHQPRDAAPADEVRCQDLVDVGSRLGRVPHPFGVDHHGGPELAAVEAARAVDACRFEAQLLGARLHVVAQLLGPLGLAEAARMTRRPLVGADEDVGAVEERRIVFRRIQLRFRVIHMAGLNTPAENG